MKRQISLIAALVMIITTIFSNSVFAASFTDVDEDNRYRNAIITLNKLGVIDGYDDGTFKPAGEITRGEFTKMLIAALGFGDNTTEPTEFDDVKDHWARTYIKTAYDMGIVNGTGERTFEPNALVTYEQALKMLVCTINKGYSTGVEYPQGYITIAENWRLGTNVANQANSAPAARQVIAQALYNALEIQMYEKNSLGVWEKTDKTILSEGLDVVKVRGTLVGVEDTKTAECTENLIRNQIAVKSAATSGDVVVVNLGDFTEKTVGELAKMIGNELTIYYKQGDSDYDKELKVLDAETTANSTSTHKHNVFAGFSGNTFKYIDGPGQKNLKMADAVTVIYNGQAVEYPVTVEAKLEGEDKEADNMQELLGYWLGTDEEYSIRGEVTFTDSGDNGDQNIVTINDYKTIIAYKAPTTSDYRLQNKLKTADSIDLNPDDISRKVYIEKNGKEIAATAIKANDVVSYTKSLDGSILNVYVIDEKITGKVNSINSTDNTITISNEEYDLDENCIDYIQKNEGRELTSGVEGTFYFDKLGAVVYATLKDAVENPYAYITDVREAEEDDTAYVITYMPSVSTKSTQTYKLASKVKFNGKGNQSYATVAAELKTIAENTNPDATATGLYSTGAAANIDYTQPVRIKVSGNEITEIYTFDTEKIDENGDIELAQNEDPTKLVRYKELKEYYYTGSTFKKNYSGSVEFSVNSKTTVLYVPKDRSEKASYSKKTISNAFTSGEYYWVEAYDVNKSNVASLVILYGDSGNLNEVKSTTDYSIVANTPQDVYDESTDSTTSLISVYAGATTSTKDWKAANPSDYNEVKAGDVIQFAYDDENKIYEPEYRLRYDEYIEVLNTGNKILAEDKISEGTEIYSWSQEESEQTKENEWQKYKFDFRYPKSDESKITPDAYYETYTSSSLGVVPKSRVCIYNVYQLVEDTNGAINKLFLTKESFVANADGEFKLREDVEYDEVTVSSNTRFLRMENTSNGVAFDEYVAGTTASIQASDLKAADVYGVDCSKIMVCTMNGSTKLVVVLPEN